MKKLLVLVIILLFISTCNNSSEDFFNRNIECHVIVKDRCRCSVFHDRSLSVFTESCSVMREGGYRVYERSQSKRP
jgi:hypothetical protein